MSEIQVAESGRGPWATLVVVTVNGLGRIAPRLQVVLRPHPSRLGEVTLDDVTLRLEHRQELLGEARIVATDLRDGSHVAVEVPVSPRLLRYVTASLVPTAISAQIDASLRGLGHYTLYPPPPGRVAGTANDPAPGEPRTFTLESGMPSQLQIPRSEWFEHVIKPTAGEQFEYLEIALPLQDATFEAAWRASVASLHNAERAYAIGDDPSVFLHLRGALDGLPGAKTDIVAGITDAVKRKAMDDLLKKAGDYLHSGRHVTASGDQAGTFPVDHLDAAFALDLVRVALSHLSLILSAERSRRET